MAAPGDERRAPPPRLVIDLDSVRGNAVLDGLALPVLDAAAAESWTRRPQEGDEPRVWFCEPEPYRAGTWPRARRVVQVIVERPGELFPRSFRLLTSLSAAEAPPQKLLVWVAWWAGNRRRTITKIGICRWQRVTQRATV